MAFPRPFGWLAIRRIARIPADLIPDHKSSGVCNVRLGFQRQPISESPADLPLDLGRVQIEAPARVPSVAA